MRLTYTKKIVKLKNKTYTVVIPDNIDGFINRPQVVFDADRKGFEAILLSMLLMINDKNIIVYFPLWKNQLPMYYLPHERKLDDKSRIIYDVVFVHHAVQMPISDWKAIRGALKKIKSEKVSYKSAIEIEYQKYDMMYKRYMQTDKYFKKTDIFSLVEKFDTYFFVAGKYSLIDFFLQLKKLLDYPLEESFVLESAFDYFAVDAKNSDEGEVEFGYYDIKLENDIHKSHVKFLGYQRI